MRAWKGTAKKTLPQFDCDDVSWAPGPAIQLPSFFFKDGFLISSAQALSGLSCYSSDSSWAYRWPPNCELKAQHPLPFPGLTGPIQPVSSFFLLVNKYVRHIFAWFARLDDAHSFIPQLCKERSEKKRDEWYTV